MQPINNQAGLRKVINREIGKYSELYETEEEISVKVVTWNVSGIKAPEDFDVSHFFDKDHLPEIVVVGIQEVIPAVSNWKGDRDKVRADKW